MSGEKRTISLHLVHELRHSLFVLLLSGQINHLIDGVRVGEATQHQLEREINS